VKADLSAREARRRGLEAVEVEPRGDLADRLVVEIARLD
jgi:hypothetical protein